MKPYAIIVISLLSFGLSAQSTFIKNQEFSFTMGVSAIDIEKLTPSAELDFVNYFDTYPENPDYVLVKLGYKFDYGRKMAADIKLVMMDDFLPDNFDVSTHYYIVPRFGIGVGSMLHKDYISFFEQFQIESYPDYILLDQNGKQFTAYDLSFYVSPAFNPFKKDAFQLLFKCDIGLSSFMKEEAVFYHKKNLSNERMHFHYRTLKTFQPYVQPKAELKVKAFDVNKVSVGFIVNSSYYFSKRSIDYKRTIRTWTAENSVVALIKPPKHRYSRFEVNGGMFLRW